MNNIDTLKAAVVNLKARLDTDRSHRDADGTYDPDWLYDIVAKAQAFARLAKTFETHNAAAREGRHAKG